MIEDAWFLFRIECRVVAQTEKDAFRILEPALEVLRKLDPVNLQPSVELIYRDEPFYGKMTRRKEQ